MGASSGETLEAVWVGDSVDEMGASSGDTLDGYNWWRPQLFRGGPSNPSVSHKRRHLKTRYSPSSRMILQLLVKRIYTRRDQRKRVCVAVSLANIQTNQNGHPFLPDPTMGP